jgi:hypothetical protein
MLFAKILYYNYSLTKACLIFSRESLSLRSMRMVDDGEHEGNLCCYSRHRSHNLNEFKLSVGYIMCYTNGYV